MTKNQADPVKTSKPFHFEGEIKDSDYLGVCRADFKTEKLPMSCYNEVGEEDDKDVLDSAYKTTNRIVVLDSETMILLPNWKIKLSFLCR
jgi:hypothetical protein